MSRVSHFALIFLGLVFSTASYGQSSRGTVNGLVSDPSAAVINGAKVELQSVTTGVKRETISNESGYYRFDAVDLGSYEVIVTASGFRQLKTAPFQVVANQVRTVDARLEVGEQKNVVQVVAESVQLQVEAPVRGANVGSAQITQLPVSLRNPAALALTAPGVSSNRSAPGVGTFSVNGARGRSNNFLIDGTENNDISVAGQGFQITNPDAVQEVSVQTSNFDSEYGRAGGAVVNVITKSGTNDFHGSASFLLDVTNDDATTLLQSLDPAVKERGKPLPGTEQWWGGTVGGPVVKNKLFFFQSFQEQRQRSSGSSDVVAPSAVGRATLNAVFPKGTNPRVDLLNSVTAGLSGEANKFPVALGNGRPDVEFGLAITSYPQTLRDRQTTTRIDYALSEKNQISGRYLYDDNVNPVAALNFPSFITSQQNRYQNVLASWTRVISPAMTNELRLPYNRIGLSFPNDAPDPLAPTLPLYSIAGLTASTVGRSIGGYMGVQTNLPQGRIANNYGLQDTLSWIRGSHSFRTGAELLLQRSRQYAPIVERGRLAYAASAGYTGFANFVDDFGGSSGSVQRDFGNPAYYPNLFRQAYFAQDRWRIRPSLTLTLGIRYEYFGLPMNSLRTPGYEGIFNIDPVTFTGPFSLPNKVQGDKNNFSPAFGLAWSPASEKGLLGRLLGNRKTVIRTGFQMGYDSFFNNIASNAATSTPNVVVTQVVSTVSAADPRGTANLSATLPTTPRPFSALDGQNTIWKTLVNPYYERWSFGIQREFTPTTVLDVSYVGSKGTKLFATEQFNPVVPASMRILPTTTAPIPSSRLGTRYDPLSGSRAIRTNNGSSIYNSLQVNLSKRTAHGFFGNFGYTWSKLLDYGSEIFSYSNAAATSAVPTIFGGLPAERGISLFDRTHRAVIVYGYDLPWMKEQKGILGRVAGGWSVSGITTFETGVPVNVNNGVDADGIDGASDRPNFNPNGQPGVRAVPSSKSSTGYVNPDLPAQPAIDPATAQYIGLPPNASSTPAPTGNLARNTFRSAPTSNWDMNLFKKVNITERFHAEFRTEFYNIWNHPQRGLGSVSPFSPASSTPSSNVTSSAAGQFLNLGILDGGGRVIRYQLKFIF
ncbi:MAG: TonB-dependent receptor [Bryobacterales bacterium]|nr:TonB-dependent receptor [Bryobacterales bacterium]